MEVLRQNWLSDGNRNPFLMFKENIRRIKTTLTKCSKETNGDIFQQLVIREDIVKVKKQLYKKNSNAENREVLQRAQTEHKKYLHLEEKF